MLPPVREGSGLEKISPAGLLRLVLASASPVSLGHRLKVLMGSGVGVLGSRPVLSGTFACEKQLIGTGGSSLARVSSKKFWGPNAFGVVASEKD